MNYITAPSTRAAQFFAKRSHPGRIPTNVSEYQRIPAFGLSTTIRNAFGSRHCPSDEHYSVHVCGSPFGLFTKIRILQSQSDEIFNTSCFLFTGIENTIQMLSRIHPGCANSKFGKLRTTSYDACHQLRGVLTVVPLIVNFCNLLTRYVYHCGGLLYCTFGKTCSHPHTQRVHFKIMLKRQRVIPAAVRARRGVKSPREHQLQPPRYRPRILLFTD